MVVIHSWLSRDPDNSVSQGLAIHEQRCLPGCIRLGYRRLYLCLR
jgi:hypothetical protein